MSPPGFDSSETILEVPAVEIVSAADIPFVLAVEDAPFVLPVCDEVKPPPGGLGVAICLCLLFGLAEVIIAIPFGFVGALGGIWKEPRFQIGVTAFVSVAAAIVVALCVDLADVCRTVALRRCRPMQLVLVVLLAPTLAPIATAAYMLVNHALGWDAAIAARPSFFDYLDQTYAQFARLSWPWAIACGCLAPAVSEELFFRGILGRRLLAKYGPVAGVLLTTTFFALAHVDPARMAATFVLGLVLHGVYLATRSLLPGMVLHAVYNFTVISAAKLASADGWDLTGQSAARGRFWLLLIVAGATAALLLRALWQTRTHWFRPDGSKWSAGYASAESPPPAGEAVPRSANLSLVLGSLIVMSYAGLGGAYSLAADQPTEWQVSHHRNRGNDLWKGGNLDGAIAEYDAALELNPDDVYTLGNRGGVCVQKDDAIHGIEDLDRAIALGGDESVWFSYRAWAHWKLGHFDESIADYTAALNLAPLNAEARFSRGCVYRFRAIDRHKHHDFTGAIRDYNAALADNPSDVVAAANGGMVYVWLRQYARAKEDLDQGLKVYPDSAPWVACRGTARWGLGDLDGALEDYAEAVRLDPSDMYPRVERGRIFVVKDDYEAALEAFDDALREGADSADLHANCGLALSRLRRYADAQGEFLEALRQQPDQRDASYELAWLHAAAPVGELRNGPEAVKLAKRFCESTKWTEPNWLSALAAAEAECGHFAEAVRWQTEALRLNPPDDREFHEMALELYRDNQPYRLAE